MISGPVMALDRLSLSLKKGESLGIIGESGSGKTTFGKAIMGICEGTVEGVINFKGRNLLALSGEEMRCLRWNEISMVRQNTGTVLNPAYTVEEQIMEPILEHTDAVPETARKKASMLIEKVGLPSEKLKAFPNELSGGEKQRVMIAMALSNEPSLVILDEPTASLDAITRRQIIDLFSIIKEECSLIVISHDVNTVASLDKIAVLYSSRLMEYGDTGLILKSPRHPYTRALLKSHPFMHSTKDLQGIRGHIFYSFEKTEGCRFSSRCIQKTELCEKEMPELKQWGDRMLACHRGGVHTLLKVNKVNASYTSRNGGKNYRVLKDLSFEMDIGDIVSLVGQTGCGKSTLARCLTRILKYDSGDIIFDGEKIEGIEPLAYHKKVQLIFQDPLEATSPRLNVLRIVKEPLDLQGNLDEAEKVKKVKKTLEEVSLPSSETFLKKYPHQLSGGELQRVTIARALVNDPFLLIADEPTSFLDVSIQAKILKLLMELQNQRGLTLLFITHDIALARKVSDRILVMKEGRIIEGGSGADLIAYPRHPYTKTLIKKSFSRLGLLEKSDIICDIKRDAEREDEFEREMERDDEFEIGDEYRNSEIPCVATSVKNHDQMKNSVSCQTSVNPNTQRLDDLGVVEFDNRKFWGKKDFNKWKCILNCWISMIRRLT